MKYSDIRGKRFVLTGPMYTTTYKIRKSITNAGGFVDNAVNQSTDYLITGAMSNSTSNLRRATSLGIQRIDHLELSKALASKNVETTYTLSSEEDENINKGSLDLSSFFE